jgi:hypothetical protein
MIHMYKALSLSLSTLCPCVLFLINNLLRSTSNLSVHENGRLVGEVGDIAHDSGYSVCLQGLGRAVLRLPLKGGLDAVLGIGAEFDDGIALETVWPPVLEDEGHVGGEVVVHVELCTLGVENLGGAVC